MIGDDEEDQEEMMEDDEILNRFLELLQELNNEKVEKKKTPNHYFNTVVDQRMTITNKQMRDTISERALSN